MINFRYHVISVIAVVLGLGAGLGLGMASQRRLSPDQATLQQRNQHLRAQLDELGGALAGQADLTRQLAPAVLHRRLAGTSVVLLSTPAGSGYVDPVASMLAMAGAAITGRIEMTDQFGAPTRADELLDLAQTAWPPGVTTGLPVTGDGVAASSSLLADVLLRRTPEVPDGDRRSVLSAYASEGFLVTRREVVAAADAIVVVAGAPAAGPDAQPRNRALVTLVGALGHAGRCVVSGPTAAGEGNLVAQVRADQELATMVSTVDNVTTATGQLVTAWAVADLSTGRVGHYGTAAGALALPALTP